MEQHAAALDMAQKAVADAGAVGRALDQAGNVGDDEFMPLVADDAELWAQGSERIGADLCLRVADRVDEGRLAGVGQADQPGVGEQFQPQPHPHLLARPAGAVRSEEHTSELQSLMRISYAVFCLKKKNNT